jgi:GTPase
VENSVNGRRARQRAFCIAAAPNEADLTELKELLRTAGVAVAGELTQRRPEPDPDRYLGKGKLAELKQAIKEADANLVAVDDELKPRQERNLEQALDVPVIDRTAIILDIFADHAHTAEGKLQVELAQLEYNLARMRGLWTHLERLGGGIATRGPGESQIETDRRLARDRISALKRRLDHTKATRGTMRRERERAGLPTVALAGYTNAGKSTLLNALTGSDVGVRERLFHTLDPTTRSFEIGGRSYLLTDTVGFIRKLPHQLVEAFSATLEEALGADLIVHVADASVAEDELHEMLDAVDAVLAETGAGDTPRLLALNKVDLIEGDRSGADRRRELSFRFPRAVQVSGSTGEGLDDLREAIEARFLATLRPMELLVPYGEGGTLSELHDLAGQLERTDTAEGVRVSARVPAAAAPRFERFSTNGGASE